jgi:hypothetical protein
LAICVPWPGRTGNLTEPTWSNAVKTLKNLAAAVVISFVAAVGAQPVHAAEQANGIQINGIQINGFSLNGFSLNGFSLNGFSLNGFSLNGLSLNGLKRNGFTVNGMKSNGFVLNGIPVAGHWLEAAQVIAVTLPESVAR